MIHRPTDTAHEQELMAREQIRQHRITEGRERGDQVGQAVRELKGRVSKGGMGTVNVGPTRVTFYAE